MKVRNLSFHKVGTLGIVVMICLFCLAGQANANESFTLSASFYQGIDLNAGMIELDATVLTLKFGENGEIEVVFASGDQDNPFEFSAAVDFHFEYEAGVGDPILFAPDEDIVGLVVLTDTDFDALGPDMLADLTFHQDISPFTITATDTIVLLTRDQTYIKLGNLSQVSGMNVEFSYQKMAAPPTVETPEPGTLLLFGLGLLGLLHVLRRKAR